MDKTAREGMLVNAICILMVLVFLAGIIYNITSDEFRGGVDDLFTIMVCLALALIFAVNPLLTIWNGPMGEKFRNRKATPAAGK